MGRAIDKKRRAQTYKTLSAFFQNDPQIDLTVYCREFGKSIFYGVPYIVNKKEYEAVFEITFLWIKAKCIENISNGVPAEELPQTPFTTMYTSFFKCGKNIQSPISFNTGGGYRHIIYLTMYAHNDSEEYFAELRKALQDYR